MPQKRIEYGGKIHEFPDSFTDDDISAALAQEDNSRLRDAGPGQLAAERLRGAVSDGIEAIPEMVQGTVAPFMGALNPATIPDRVRMAQQMIQGAPGMLDSITAPFKRATQSAFELGAGALPDSIQPYVRFGAEKIAPGINAAPPPESPLYTQDAGFGGKMLVGALLGKGLQGAAKIGPTLTQNETAAKIFNAMGGVPAGRRGTQLDIASGEFKTLPGRAMVDPEAGPFRNIARALRTSPKAAQPVAAAELKNAGETLSKELASSTEKINISPIIPGDPGAFAKFKSALEATGLERKVLRGLTPSEVNALRSDLGGRINWSPMAMTTDANEALMDAYSRLNSSIGTAVPAAKPMTKRLQEALLYNRALAHTMEQGAGKMPTAIRIGAKYGPSFAAGAAIEEIIRRRLK